MGSQELVGLCDLAETELAKVVQLENNWCSYVEELLLAMWEQYNFRLAQQY